MEPSEPGVSRGTALVTGTSAGIGRTICERLLAQGYTVLALARRATGIDHPQLVSVQVDLADAQATAAAAAQIAREHAVTTLIHNAGIIRPALVADAKREDLDTLVQLHLGSALQLLQACLPAMRAARFGRVVLMSSRAALGLQTRTAYSATKSGMLGMARTWALELAPDGITVNVVAPGPIRATEMFHAVVPEDSERERALAASIPVKRLGDPSDVARAVEFFIHPDAGFVTGQTLYVCGGASVGSLAI